VSKKDENLTVRKLLDDDHLRELASKIVSEDMDNIVLIYRSKTDNILHWDTTIKDYPMLFGCLRMIDDLIFDEWQHGDSEQEIK